jgi:magnesium-transporting ATPase (P-type)
MMDEQEQQRRLSPAVWVGVALAAIAAIAAVVALLRNRLRRQPEEPPPLWPQPLSADALLDLQGLTEQEAATRKLEGQDNSLVFNPPRSPREIWLESFFSLFTLSLSALAIIQFLLSRWLDGLLTLGVMALNTTINVIQEMLARRRLKEIEEASRLRATVIREGKARSLDPSDVVRGDILVAGPGDQILVDGLVVGEGQILVDESMLTGQSQRQVKRAGDAVYAGSFCASGRAAYEGQLVGDERLIVTLTDKTQPAEEERTPLEKIVAGVMRFLLLFVFLYAFVLLLTFLRIEGDIPVDVFNSAASVIFNIAPAGLFFMIVVTYATGTADLGKLGALVHRARSVESLALTNVLCFARAGVLTGGQVEVEPVDPPEGEEPLAESRLRQILGDYARASTTPGLVMRAMKSSLPGSRRDIQEQQPFLSVQGWSGIAFDEEDLRGVYILGDPQILESCLVTTPRATEAVEEEEQPPGWRRMFAPVGRLLRRSKPEEDETPADAVDQPSEGSPEQLPAGASAKEPPNLPYSEAETHSADAPRSNALQQVTGRLRQLTRREGGKDPTSAEESPSQVEEDGSRPSFFRRLTSPLRRLAQREGAAPAEEGKPEEEAFEEQYLLFAYYPEIVPLHDVEGAPKLPGGLTPLCNLRYTEKVRPEAIETIQAFSQMGMSIKVFASGSPQQTAAILQQAATGQDGGPSFRTVSGAELAGLGPGGWTELISRHTVFGDLTPEQAGQVVEAVRHEGRAVATVGDGVNDLPALLQSNLAIARQASSQAALSVADIVVLEESPKALLTVLDKGQRIVNGLLDVLKLYLTQVLYLSLLIAAIWIVSNGFPYLSGQGTIIAMATVSLPSIGLSLWASAGILPSADLRWILARFIGPAAVTMAIAGTVVYVRFLDISGKVAYAQFSVTHVLVLMGLVLVVFTKPPWRSLSDGGVQDGDWRPTILALVLLGVFLVVTRIPLAQELLQIGTLDQPDHYAFIVGTALVWAIVLQLIWRIIPLARKVQPVSRLTR